MLPDCLKTQAIPRVEADSLLRLLRVSKPDTNQVKLLLQLGAYQVYKPGEYKADMDSALLFIRQAEDLSRRLNYLKGQGNSNRLFSQIYREKGEQDIGKSFINKAILLFSKYGFYQELGEAYLEQKHFYSAFSSKEELQERIRIIKQALAAFQQSGNKLKQAIALEELADLHSIEGNMPQALLELKQSLAKYQDVDYRQLQGVYNLLGAVSSQMGDYKEGIRYGLLAVQTAEQLGDSTTQICTIFNRLGSTYYYLNNYEQAITYYQKGLSRAIQLNDHNAIFILVHNISNVLQRINKSSEALALVKDIAKKYPPAETYSRVLMTANFIMINVNLKQYTQAKPYFNELLQIEEKYELSENDYITFSNTVVHYLFDTQQYSSARKYLTEHETRVNRLSILKESAQVQKLWFKLDSAQGNYLAAINHYQRYKALGDSLFNETKSKQVANLEIQYKTEQKEQDIKLKEKNIALLTQKSQIQQATIGQRQTERNALIGGTVLLMAMLGLGYNRYLLKQRSNQLLETRQEEINHKNTTLQLLLTEKEWLLKEIHHRVKNNLQVVMSLLESQANSLQDKAALSAIQESQHRVQAMALIHQKLYQSESVARIPMTSYIEEVVAYLNDSYSLQQPIRFDVEVEDIELDVTQAVPLGLIINEAITNSFKYAFPDGRSGTISLRLHLLEEASYELTLADDGVGLPAGYTPSRSRSLGMKLIHGLSRQLRGKVSITSPPGMHITLLFNEEQLTSTYIKASYA